MSAEPWSTRPKINGLSLTDILMRRVPTGGANLNQEILFSDIQTFLQGSATKLIANEADLPATVNGVHQLEQNKNYIFTEPGSFADPILIPAGYVGWLRTTFLSVLGIEYSGTGAFLRTLNINGSIISITDAGGVAITVTTSAAHGLFDGQFVNITGTGQITYNVPRLEISNVTPTTFEVQIPFVAPDTGGAFNTGYEALQISDITFTNQASANLFDLTSNGNPVSFLIIRSMTEFGFLSPGIIRKSPNTGIDVTLLVFITDGLTLENCISTTIFRTQIPSLDIITTARGLTFTGSGINEVVLDTVNFDMGAVEQRPIRLDSSINAVASVTIQNSPDNLVAALYYDTDASGLDQTDPRVTALNNGSRENSMTLAEARSGVILEVDATTPGPVPIENVTPVLNDWIEDPSTERFTVDDATGIITYTGLRPVSVKIEYSLEAQQTSTGGSQDASFELNINASPQAKTLRMITIVPSVFTPVSYDGGNFDIIPGDIFQIFLDIVSTSSNTDIQNATLLITRN